MNGNRDVTFNGTEISMELGEELWYERECLFNKKAIETGDLNLKLPSINLLTKNEIDRSYTAIMLVVWKLIYVGSAI